MGVDQSPFSQEGTGRADGGWPHQFIAAPLWEMFPRCTSEAVVGQLLQWCHPCGGRARHTQINTQNPANKSKSWWVRGWKGLLRGWIPPPRGDVVHFHSRDTPAENPQPVILTPIHSYGMIPLIGTHQTRQKFRGNVDSQET